MAKKKEDHIIIRNSKLFCSNCGREQAVPYPIEIPVFVAMGKAFGKSHKNCIKTWEQPFPNPEMPESQKAIFWLNHGERGTSSEFMYQTISRDNINAHLSYPHDPSDFKRCYGLLLFVPEWHNKLHMLKETSPVWSNLVDNWDKLTEMLKEQMVGKENDMYNFMQTLGC